ncbi:MAG: hypothetical protein VYB09_07805 [Planctomycetota bacterium]|nr:hypothetical protein [Planctomycetota bacterium]MEE2989257.1 hypothetical protein [Planctomycetota bacterium]
MRKRRCFVLAAVLFAMGVVILIPRQDVAEAPDPESSGVIRVGKETTRISGPLKKNGNVDYLAAINKEKSRGVTPANNAGVPIWQAFGRQELVPELVEEYFRRLGMTPPPENGEYYIELADFLEKEHLASGGEDTVVALSAVRDKATRVFDEIMSGPWSEKKYPQVVRWLKRNERTLKLAHEASRRTHYYMPYLTGDEQEGQEATLVMMVLPGAVHGRTMGRLLVIDGFGHIGSGKLQKAREDFLACHRIGRVCSKGGTVIEGLVGAAIDGIAIRGEIALVEHGGLSVDQLRSYQKQLEQLPPFSSMVEKITVLERYIFLDVAQNLATHGPKVLREIQMGSETDGSPLLESVGKGVFGTLVDWNIVLKMGNEAYDRIEKIGAIKSFSEREEKFEEFEKEIKEMTVHLGTASGLAKQLLLSGKNVRQVASEQMGGILIALLLPSVTRAVDVLERGVMNTQMVQSAMALSMFQEQHGRYPARLGELVPVFIKKVPIDIYAEKPVRYIQQGDGFYLYSVGRNRQDDGGRSQAEDPAGDDVGYKVNFPSPGTPGRSR